VEEVCADARCGAVQLVAECCRERGALIGGARRTESRGLVGGARGVGRYPGQQVDDQGAGDEAEVLGKSAERVVQERRFVDRAEGAEHRDQQQRDGRGDALRLAAEQPEAAEDLADGQGVERGGGGGPVEARAGDKLDLGPAGVEELGDEPLVDPDQPERRAGDDFDEPQSQR
jgi:hypothetical protein